MATSKTGTCSACGYSPVAFDAACCPRCGAPNTRPSVADRFVGRGMLFGLGGGALAGLAIGWACYPPDERATAMIALPLVCSIGGLILGLFLGLGALVAADLFGRVS